MTKKKHKQQSSAAQTGQSTATAVAESTAESPAPSAGKATGQRPAVPSSVDTSKASPAVTSPVSVESTTPTPSEADRDEKEEVQKGFKGQAKKDMENVTGYVEERKDEVDENRLNKAMSFITSVSKKQREQIATREKELEKVTIAKEDVDLIMNELEVGKAVAERALKENKGDVVATLTQLVQAA